jgi:hypothetical protein
VASSHARPRYVREPGDLSSARLCRGGSVREGMWRIIVICTLAAQGTGWLVGGSHTAKGRLGCDADVRRFFDAIDHKRLVKLKQHR